MKIHITPSVLALMIVCFSCSESTFEEPDNSNGTEYFPLELGKFWIYQVDSIIYDPDINFIKVDSVTRQVRLAVTDTFVDLEGNLNYEIERSVLGFQSGQWQVSDIWSCRLSSTGLIWKEENLDYIKLVFPVSAGIGSWDGLALIDKSTADVIVREEFLDLFKVWDFYRYSDLGGTETIEGNEYTDVATVFHVDEDIIYHKRTSLEKYAKGVGMIYKHLEVLDTQNDDLTLPFAQRAEKGFILKAYLLDHN